jgi:hypothetical protein
MEETLLELQYRAILELCLENSAEFPTREEVVDRIKVITTKGEHLTIVDDLDGNLECTEDLPQ